MQAPQQQHDQYGYNLGAADSGGYSRSQPGSIRGSPAGGRRGANRGRGPLGSRSYTSSPTNYPQDPIAGDGLFRDGIETNDVGC